MGLECGEQNGSTGKTNELVTKFYLYYSCASICSHLIQNKIEFLPKQIEKRRKNKCDIFVYTFFERYTQQTHTFTYLYRRNTFRKPTKNICQNVSNIIRAMCKSLPTMLVFLCLSIQFFFFSSLPLPFSRLRLSLFFYTLFFLPFFFTYFLCYHSFFFCPLFYFHHFALLFFVIVIFIVKSLPHLPNAIQFQ